jgi:hypothetical protein
LHAGLGVLTHRAVTHFGVLSREHSGPACLTAMGTPLVGGSMSAPCRVSRVPVLHGILLIAAGLPFNGRLHYSIVCAPPGRIVGCCP